MEKIKELFAKAKIKYVINVDDCYATDITPDLFLIKEHMAKNKEATISFFAQNERTSFASELNALPEEDILDYLDSVCDTITEKEVRQYYTQNMMNIVPNEKSKLEEFLDNLRLENCIESYMLLTDPKEAQDYFDHIADHLDVSQERKVLWMIDKDLQGSGGASDSGISLIKNFIGSHTHNNIYALTSAQLGNMTNEEFQKSIAEELAAYDSLLACIVDKHHIIQKDYLELYEQMSRGFRQNYSGAILNNLISIYSKASEEANATINNLGNDTIYRVFFESGKAEGISPVEVFQRLLLIIVKGDIISKISEDYDDIAKLIYDYSQLCEWCEITKKDIPDFGVIRNARILECYDSFVNKRYLPISTGDIFEIGESLYILLGQACNLTIRDTGKRTAQCATLAKLQKCVVVQQTPLNKYYLKYFEENMLYEIDFNQTINVDFNVLDLCTLYEHGRAKLARNFDIQAVRYRYPHSIFSKLEAVITLNRNLIKKYDDIKKRFSEKILKMESLCEDIRELYKDNSLEIKLSFDDGIAYNVQRKLRLSEAFVDDILKRYSEYHSRKAMDYDFAGDYKIISFNVKYDINLVSFGIEKETIESLIPNYKYYQNRAFDKDEEKKRTIIAAFESEYTGEWLPREHNIKGIKCDLKNGILTIPGKYIPIMIHGDCYSDVLCEGKNSCNYKIPQNLIQGLKLRQNKTFSMDNGAEMKISNGKVSFSFPHGTKHTFFHTDALEKEVSFSLLVSRGIFLEITYG